MARIGLLLLLAGASSVIAGEAPTEPTKAGKGTVRTAVIGGMTMTGLWPEIAKRFEAETGCQVEVVATGPRPILAKAFREGKADLLTMHSGDITTDLVADGYGTNMRPWTRNDLVLAGPRSDPAKIRGLKNGVEAFTRIAEAQAPFVDCAGIGSREVCHSLWKKAGIIPSGTWFITDESKDHLNILKFAQERHAYVVVGRMPILFEKMKAADLEIFIESDPAMRRPYIVMEANPKKFPEANHAGARALSDFLLSDKVQKFLAEFGTDKPGGIPFFHPIEPAASK
jgi:tungstate transport system substrate-binding protein